MAEKKGVSFSGGGKNRIMLFIAITIVAILVGIGYWQSKNKSPGPTPSAMVAEAPKIESTPGVGKAPPREYIKLQQQQNAQEVAEAQKKGTSAVPTIIRASYLGDDVNKGNPDADATKGGISGCDLTSLRRAKQAGVSSVELRCKGCSAAALRAAGYTAGELREAGFTAKQLNEAGFSAAELKSAGFTAEELKTGGYAAKNLISAGFSAAELKAVGFSGAELKAAGFTPQQLREAGFSAQELKAAGFTAQDLVNGGFSGSELKTAGFSAEALKAAGLSAQDLANAGFSAAELKKVGFSEADLRSVVFGHSSKTECNANELKRLRANGVPAPKLKEMGCSSSALRAVGYTVAELKTAGFSAAELKAAGFSPTELKEAGFSAKELKASGFNPKDLKAAGFSASELKDAGYGPGELKNSGFSAEELKDAGFSPEELRKAGFTADELKRAGFSAEQLKAAGYSDGELARAGVDVAAMNGQPQSQMGTAAGANLANAAPAAQVVSLGGGVSSSGAQTDPAAAALERLQRMQAIQVSDQERKQKLDQMRQGMTTQANELLSSWSPPTPQMMVTGVPDIAQGGAAGGVPLAAGSQIATSQNGQAASLPPGSYDNIKAGTIMFATLDVGINTDEQSPILATIVEGQLRGAKLLGEFKRQEKKVLLSFNLMNVPKLPNSVPVSVVAIDEKTAHTMLADRVDSHYMLRYGTLFASSFISGLADAVGRSGSSTVISPVGVTVSQPPLNTTKLVVTGLGAVGKQYSSSLSSNFTTPPTVYVNPGTGIGILFTSDLKVPKTLEELAKQ